MKKTNFDALKAAATDWQQQAIAAGWTPPPDPVDPLIDAVRGALKVCSYETLGDCDFEEGEPDAPAFIAALRKAGVIHKSEVENGA